MSPAVPSLGAGGRCPPTPGWRGSPTAPGSSGTWAGCRPLSPLLAERQQHFASCWHPPPTALCPRSWSWALEGSRQLMLFLCAGSPALPGSRGPFLQGLSLQRSLPGGSRVQPLHGLPRENGLRPPKPALHQRAPQGQSLPFCEPATLLGVLVGASCALPSGQRGYGAGRCVPAQALTPNTHTGAPSAPDLSAGCQSPWVWGWAPPDPPVPVPGSSSPPGRWLAPRGAEPCVTPGGPCPPPHMPVGSGA